MALKPTIYKVQIELADSDRNHYESLALTLAQHPSETIERMAVRILAFCLNAQNGLELTRGLSTTDEPALLRHNDTGEIEQWIEIGQPEEPRLRKASGKALSVCVYAFAKSAATWWQLNSEAMSALPRVLVWQFDWQEVVAFAALITRNVSITVSIAGGVIYADVQGQACSLEPVSLLGER